MSQTKADHYARMARALDSHRRRAKVAMLMVRPLTRAEEQIAIEAFIARFGIRRVVISSEGTITLVVVPATRLAGD